MNNVYALIMVFMHTNIFCVNNRLIDTLLNKIPLHSHIWEVSIYDSTEISRQNILSWTKPTILLLF